MDLTSAWFLALMLVVGGGVALLADHLGRILGKKRLRIGKLRPKHTAMLMTAITGVLVTFVTIVLVAAISAEAREWILRGRKAIREGILAVQDLDQTQSSLEDALATKSSLKIELDETTKQLEKSRTGIKKTAEQTKQLERSLDTLQLQLGSGRKSLADTRRSLAGLKTQFSKLSGSFELLSTSYSQLSGMRNEAEKEVERLQGELSRSEGEMKLSAERRKEVEQELFARQQDLKDAQKRYNDAQAAFQKDLTDSQAKINETQRQLNLLDTQARAAIDTSRDQPMVFFKGEELTRVSLDTIRDRSDALSALNRAISVARMVSDERNAAQPGREPAVGFAPLRTSEGRMISVLEQTNQVIDLIVRDAQPKLLMVKAPFNVFRTERVLIQVEVVANPVVFRQGDVVAETRINGDQGDESILAAVTEFLRNQVRSSATRAKMIPVTGSGATFGEVPPDDILRLVNQLRAYARPVRVQAIAKKDTRAGGPLELEFRLR